MNKIPLFNKIILLGFSSLFILLGVSSIIFYNKGYRLNLTESYPIGIYRLKDASKLSKNDMILFCPPKNNIFIEAYKRGYIEDGLCPSGFWALQKKIVGLPGDRVVINDYVYINGSRIKNSNVFKVDPQGKKMLLMAPDQRDIIIPPGKMFVISDYNKLSYDSRYFGLVDQNLTLGKTVPIYTIADQQFKELKSY